MISCRVVLVGTNIRQSESQIEKNASQSGKSHGGIGQAKDNPKPWSRKFLSQDFRHHEI
jgi:hypothetical protein